MNTGVLMGSEEKKDTTLESTEEIVESSLDSTDSIDSIDPVPDPDDSLLEDDEEASQNDENLEEELEETPSENSYKSKIDEDDEELLQGDDNKITEEEAYAIFKQSENAVSWTLLNFYDENGERKSKYKLRADPPVFRLESSDGNYAEFVVTKELASSLSNKFQEIRRGFFGLDKGKDPSDKLSQKNSREWIDKQLQKVKEKPISTLFPILLIILVIVLLFI